MPALPIQRSNLVDGAYAAIKQLILNGELSPGSKLIIDDLARRLGVSNSPIREALRRLENERWVETVPFRGSFVPRLEEKELADLYEIRAIIELGALSKALADPPAAQMAKLEQACGEIEAALGAGDALAYLLADGRFHQTIVDMADNRRLSEMFATLVEQGRCFLLGRTPASMARQRGEPDDHAELLRAIRERRAGKALKLLKEHLHISRSEIHKLTQTKEAAKP